MINFKYGVIIEADDLQYVVNFDKIIHLENEGIVTKYFFSSVSFISVAWFFSR